MAGTLHFLGIHEGDIEHASDIVEAVCDKHGIHSDCVWSAVLNEFEEAFGWTRVTFVRGGFNQLHKYAALTPR